MRLIKFISGMWLILLALIVASVLIGMISPQKYPLQEAGFDLCNSMPCFMRIIPYVTEWAKAKAILSAYGELIEEDHIITVYTGDKKSSFTIIAEPDYKSVAHIQILVKDNALFPHVGEIIHQYGTPCAISYSNQGVNLDVITLIYPAMHLQILQQGNRLNLDLPVLKITMVHALWLSGSESLCTLKRIADSPVMAWHGWASWDTYKRLGLYDLMSNE